MKNTLYLVAAVMLVSLLALSASVPASSAESIGELGNCPSVVITDSDPANPNGVARSIAPPGHTFTFNIQAAETSTVLGTLFGVPSPIVVGDPAGTFWILTDGIGAPVVITMPDVGDMVAVTFPGAVVVTLFDPNGNVILPPAPYAWVGLVPPSTTILGLYVLQLPGDETVVALPFLLLESFLVIPESPLGTLAVLFSGLAGIAGILGIRRYKWSS